jgi:hypothetical protein
MTSNWTYAKRPQSLAQPPAGQGPGEQVGAGPPLAAAFSLDPLKRTASNPIQNSDLVIFLFMVPSFLFAFSCGYDFSFPRSW